MAGAIANHAAASRHGKAAARLAALRGMLHAGLLGFAAAVLAGQAVIAALTPPPEAPSAAYIPTLAAVTFVILLVLADASTALWLRRRSYRALE